VPVQNFPMIELNHIELDIVENSSRDDNFSASERLMNSESPSKLESKIEKIMEEQ
jgi:hypothetical protein